MLPGVLPVVIRLASEYGIGAVRYPRQRRSRGAERGAVAALRRGVELAAVRVLCRLGRRSLEGNGLLSADDFRGFIEAGRWRAETLAETSGDIEPGLTEMGCHPGSDDSVDAELGWRDGGEQDLAALTSPDVAAAVMHSGVRLTTYRSLLGNPG